jgi:hypothetical protein
MKFGIDSLKLIALAGSLALSANVGAQNIFTAKLDSSLLLIGKQTNLHLSLVSDQKHPALLPVLSDTIMKGIEIVDIKKPDTVQLDNDRIQIDQDYIVTSFDSGLYYIPPFIAIEQMDTVLSNSLMLKVFTVPVDSASVENLADIKEVLKPQFVWSDYAYILYILLTMGALTLVGYYLWKYLKKKKETVVIPPELLLPPDVAALQALDRIKQEKLWQQGREKEFYTQLTDALRNYIDRRYDIAAPEMTSSEIVTSLTAIKCEKSSVSHLNQIFVIADLVKFAKFKPLADENDLSLSKAYTFVNETKEQEVVAEESVANPQSASATKEPIDKK